MIPAIIRYTDDMPAWMDGRLCQVMLHHHQAWLMRKVGFYGWTSLWRTIYVLPISEHNKLTIEWSV